MLTCLHPPPDETPTLPSPLLTLPHPCLIFSLAYNPYSCGVHSRHASNAAYHPYACMVSSQNASDASYHPYARSPLPTPLTILTLAPPISALTTPYASAPPPPILTLLRRPQDIPPTPPSTPLTPNTISATYHPYAQVLDP
ncbi:hypothetical protein O181_080265 [Austropuccinia psidii MF-1]|uniref:Uncharacterized protein n=1 Tax=Austropuccinia psidii MF-1 TaxID=1389203 RepID=A0A9Q3IIQ2_9BASI|nr:hypothetical protein [Austropuccinia psidii MF-1]